jgi:histidine ammonia-lyase
MQKPFLIDGKNLSLAVIDEIFFEKKSVSLSPAAVKRIEASRKIVDRISRNDEAYYGINTGFGILANKRISPADIEKLQENLILSHAVGTGDEVPRDVVRLMLLLKINSLAIGLSGVSLETISYLVKFFNAGVTPIVYTQGSVGASGDLAPLAHLVLAFLGQGHVYFGDKKISAKAALKRLNLSPLKLKSKEGLGLINGTQFMSAYGVHALIRATHLLKTADVAATMTLEAMRGSSSPFDKRLHDARPHQGQIETAANVRKLLTASEVLKSHANCPKVQDPYSLRCVPQVHGAVRDAVRHATMVVETEINSVTDNPLVFENGDVISGGNFHGEPLALALDFLAIALAELASISERRIYLLLGGDTIGEIKLPKLLMSDTGLNSGFMLPQYTAAALVSENKVLAHPASVDSIPTSLGQEDHVSMGSISAVKLLQVLRNAETVLAIELMCAAQGLDFIHPIKAGKGVEAAYREVRKKISFAREDRLFHDDIQTALQLVRSRCMTTAAESAVGSLH